MSGSSASLRSFTATAELVALRSLLEQLLRPVIRPVQLVAFWLAVLMPALYLPLLFEGIAAGLRSPFTGYLGLHLIVLVIGHGHKRREMAD